jgi:anti-sigma factor ChrR (cupin superfamily)
MRINADFTQRAAVHAGAAEWIASPMPGVDRKPLDRIGEEVARATSIVRYAPGSAFSAHEHGGGEEFLVLEGVFQDETGDFPAGAYVRNPPGSAHTPSSEPGCVILVKLWQFDPEDAAWVRVAPGEAAYAPAGEGVEAAPLHADAHEAVAFERWAPGAAVARDLPGGAELFVLSGGFAEGGERFVPWSWLRLPAGARLVAEAGPEGATLWIKSGHLAGPIRAPG